jgi:hypothetical protein
MAETPTDVRHRMTSFVDSLPADEAVLIPLYEAYRAANDTLVGMGKQPHVQGLAADIIASESERAADFAKVIAVKLSQLSTIKESWRERFVDAAVSHVFFVGGDGVDALSIQKATRALPVVPEGVMAHDAE